MLFRIQKVLFLFFCVALIAPGAVFAGDSFQQTFEKIDKALKLFAEAADPKSRLRVVDHLASQWYVGEDDVEILNLRNSEGLTPLMVAAKNGNEYVVLRLVNLRKGDLSHAVDLNAQDTHGNTALIIAAMDGESGVITYMSKFVEVDIRNERGETALWWAAWNGDVKSVRALLVRCADPHIAARLPDEPRDLTPHEAAFVRGRFRDPAWRNRMNPEIRREYEETLRVLSDHKNSFDGIRCALEALKVKN